VFVVDAHGKVADKFEGMAYPDELTAALDALLP
jgi:glutathione peroxidase-family protein